jgi:hypothetical protein
MFPAFFKIHNYSWTRNKTAEMARIRESGTVFAGFCILIFLTGSIAACTTSHSGTNNPVTIPAPPVPASIAPASEISETITPQVNAEQPVTAGNRKRIRDPLPEEPVTVTINSARKQLGLGKWGVVYYEPMQGNVYLVLNVTIKNTGATEGFVLNGTSLMVRDPEKGTGNRVLDIRESLRKYLENPLVLPVFLQQNEMVAGQVLFEMNDSVNYKVNLVDSNKTVLASQPVSFDNLLTNDAPVSITIHSVRKEREFNSSMPHPVSPNPGHIFLILNVTIKNNNVREGYAFDFISTHIQDLKNGNYERQSLNNGVNVIKNLENPILVPTTIKQNGTKTGQLLFGVADSTDYRLNLIGTNKTIIASRNIHVE